MQEKSDQDLYIHIIRTATNPVCRLILLGASVQLDVEEVAQSLQARGAFFTPTKCNYVSVSVEIAT